MRIGKYFSNIFNIDFISRIINKYLWLLSTCCYRLLVYFLFRVGRLLITGRPIHIFQKIYMLTGQWFSTSFKYFKCLRIQWYLKARGHSHPLNKPTSWPCPKIRKFEIIKCFILVKRMRTSSTLCEHTSASPTRTIPAWYLRCWNRIFMIFSNRTSSSRYPSSIFVQLHIRYS